MLLALGGRLSAAKPGLPPDETSGKAADVLHVLSYARPIGGDTRFVWRWIELDPSRRHSVAITSQDEADIEIPPDLARAVAATGGQVHSLGRPGARHLDRARELRSLCQDAHTVALHLFPYDIVPVIALAAGCDGVRKILVNQTDHTFWIGASVIDLLVHCRNQSPRFLTHRRGLDISRSAELPIPLPPISRGRSTSEAKRELGYGDDTIVLLTIATAFKYESAQGPSFLELVTPVLERMPKVVLIAIGPEPTGEWRAAEVHTKERVSALGARWDTDLFYDAADIYIDSYPFSSSTSLLEAGIRGVPLLAYCPPGPDTLILGPGAPGIETPLHRAGDPHAFRQLLSRLIADLDLRQQSGEAARDSILSKHTGAGWRAAVESLHQQLEAVSQAPTFVGQTEVFETGSLDLAVARLYRRAQTDLPAMIHRTVSEWPWWRRFRLLRQLQRQGFRVYPSSLLPRPAAECISRYLPFIERLLQAYLRRRDARARPRKIRLRRQRASQS
jgi:hypothetical protein